MTITLPPLPYDRNALEPAISENTMRFHYDKHHAGYVDKLNKAIEGTGYQKQTLERIVQESYDAGAQDVFNNAAQVWNHSFFWNSMTPKGGGEPEGALGRALEDAFGSYGNFRERFVKEGVGQFGSGWVWLVIDNGKLNVVATPNAETPMLRAQIPLLTCDVWEHAYYLDYQNARKAFLEAFLDKLANWRFAAEQFDNQGEGNRIESKRYQDAQHDFAEKQKKRA